MIEDIAEGRINGSNLIITISSLAEGPRHTFDVALSNAGLPKAGLSYEGRVAHQTSRSAKASETEKIQEVKCKRPNL